MVNRIRYTDADHPMAGSAFLLQTSDGVVAATAKHVLRFFRSESMDSVSFRGSLVRWEMFPKDRPSDVTVVGALINEDANESLEDIRAPTDWLLFAVERASADVRPLPPRTDPPGRGETVYVVGWRYTDEGRQHVYRGEFVRADRDSLLIDVEALADNTVPGLSGAPVIDARGQVIGLMSARAGRLQRLAPVGHALSVLSRNAEAVGAGIDGGGPVDRAETVDRLSGCRRRMHARFVRRGWVGITPEFDPDGSIRVREVSPNSPAERAGVRPGDRIRGLDGHDLDDDRAQFLAAYDAFRPGVSAVFELERNGTRPSVSIRVEPIPDAVLARWIREECGDAD